LVIRSSLIDGIRRVRSAPVIVACAFAVTLLTALPLSVALREAIRTNFGNSLAAEQALRGVNYEWWTEFERSSGFLATFTTKIIGFAAVLDNISTFLDRQRRPATIVWLGAAYILLWLFLTGGILDRYARNRPTRAHEFFAACGMYFPRFLRLVVVMGVCYYVLFRYVHQWLFSDLYQRVTRNLTQERTAFLIRVTLYLVFGALLVVTNVAFDYVKVRVVIEDRRSVIGALGAGIRFVRRNAAPVFGLYLANGLIFVIVIALYAVVAPGAERSGLMLWLGFAVSQVYLLARLWARLVFLASETALFQSRLAHIGYAASPAVRLPEPPIVEQYVGMTSPPPQQP
jgi:hypothetical protein